MAMEEVLKNRIRFARLRKGYSQQKLAELTGVSRQTICSIENGQFAPTAKLALKICQALDQKFEHLFYMVQE
ncbi:MAG: helix-turn-helix transcriptional regulator [Oscillospiraceae bacterium]|nr:helix-turn-helix transcriptional regulator [Oscillospiraceae bacterium]